MLRFRTLSLPLAAAALVLAACGQPAPTPAPTPAPVTTTASSAAPTSSTGLPAPVAPPTQLRVPASAKWDQGEQTAASRVPGTTSHVNLVAISPEHIDLEGGYDAVEFWFDGPAPSYDVRYVAQLLTDPKGDNAGVAGRAYLQVTFKPTVTDPASKGVAQAVGQTELGYPRLSGLAVLGTGFENVTNVGVGLNQKVDFRVWVARSSTAQSVIELDMRS